MRTAFVAWNTMRGQVKCTAKVRINRINLTLRNGKRRNKIKTGYQICCCGFCFWRTLLTGLISGFRRDVDEICALLGHYAAYSCISLWTFRDYLSVPSSMVKKSSFLYFLTIENVIKGSSEMSVMNCHYTLCNVPQERRSRVDWNTKYV
jgi:hypothetical protein